MYVPNDYYDAARWLQNSKRVADRGVRRTMYAGYYRAYLVRRSPDTIAVNLSWMNYDVLTFHSEGTAVLEVPKTPSGWSPLRSQGTRQLICRLANFTNVFQKNHKIYITEQDYKLTPSKIQGCRSCKSSGKMDTVCYPDACYQGRGHATCPDHSGAIPQKHGFHMVACKHGKYIPHTLYNAAICYYCSGAGRKEYGLKPISLMWDGSPIRIKNGNLVKREPSELEKRIAAYVNPFD